MNRQQRRAAMKGCKGFNKLTREQRLDRIERNGITLDDLENEYKKGYQYGCQDAVRMCYAAIVMAASDQFGFGAIRRARLLQAVDDIITMSIDGRDLMEECEKKYGYKINFKNNDPLENRVEIVDEAK